MRKHGFTLLELLVVIAILAILVTLGSKGLSKARTSAKKTQAIVEMKSIETAVKAYRNKYGKLPAVFGGDLAFNLEPTIREPFSEKIISILTNAADMDPAFNRSGIVFLDPQGDGSDGVFLDPWGYQYRIALDTDYDGSIKFKDQPVRRNVGVLSVGYYHLRGDDNEDDLLKSW